MNGNLFNSDFLFRRIWQRWSRSRLSRRRDALWLRKLMPLPIWNARPSPRRVCERYSRQQPGLHCKLKNGRSPDAFCSKRANIKTNKQTTTTTKELSLHTHNIHTTTAHTHTTTNTHTHTFYQNNKNNKQIPAPTRSAGFSNNNNKVQKLQQQQHEEEDEDKSRWIGRYVKCGFDFIYSLA